MEANERTSGPVLTSGLVVVLSHGVTAAIACNLPVALSQVRVSDFLVASHVIPGGSSSGNSFIHSVINSLACSISPPLSGAMVKDGGMLLAHLHDAPSEARWSGRTRQDAANASSDLFSNVQKFDGFQDHRTAQHQNENYSFCFVFYTHPFPNKVIPFFSLFFFQKGNSISFSAYRLFPFLISPNVDPGGRHSGLTKFPTRKIFSIKSF